MVGCHTFDFVLGAKDDGDALVELFWGDVEDAFGAVGCEAAGLFDEQAHGVGFVHEAQFAGFAGGAFVPWVHEDAAAHEDAVYFGDHGGDPAHVEVFAQRAVCSGEAFVDVFFDGFVPMAHVAHVDGEFLCVFGDGDVFAGEYEFAGCGVECEHDDSAPECEGEDGLGTIQAVACGDLVAAELEEVLFCDVFVSSGLAFEDAEDGTDADVDVDVGGAVKGVEEEEVVTCGEVLRDGEDLFHFFGGHAGEGTAPAAAVDEHVVGDNVEFFLFFALDVFGACTAEDACKGTLGDGGGDAFAGLGNSEEQGGEVCREEVFLLLCCEVL